VWVRPSLVRSAVVTVALTAVFSAVGPAGPAAGDGLGCARSSGNIIRYCGPAEARLTAFADVAFRRGSCMQRQTGGVPLLHVRIGSKALGRSRSNAGLTMFSLELTGPRSHPTSGLVVAYAQSRVWQGRATWFRGDAGGGSFRAAGIFPTRGGAAGSFRC
jgi:hypothetical protein